MLSSGQRSRSLWHGPLPSFLLCLLLAFLAFGRGLGGDFLNFDDDRTVLGNPAFELGFPRGLLRLLDPTFPIAEVWYPVTYLSLWLDYGIGTFFRSGTTGPPPALGFHLHSLLLHALAGFLLLRLLRDLGLEPGLAWLGTLPFLLHPALAENVVWISSRKDLCAGLFTLWALLLGRRRLRSGAPAWPVWLLALLAFLSKGSALVLPLLALLLWRPPFLERRESPFLRFWLPLLLLAGAAALHQGWLAARAGVAGRNGDPLAVPGTFLHYFGTLLWPAGLSVHYPLRTQLEAFRQGFPAKALYLSVLVLGALVLCLRGRGRLRLAGLGLALMLLSLLPYNNLLPATSTPAADRYLYLVLPWSGLLLSGLLCGLPPRLRRTSGWVLMILLAVSYLPRSFQRAEVFTDSERLWLSNLALHPGDAVSHSNLGKHYLTHPRFARDGEASEKGFRHLEEALQLAREPEHRLRMALELYYWQRGQGQLRESLTSLREAVKAADLLTESFHRLKVEKRVLLAQALLDAGREEEGIEVLDQVLEMDPEEADALGLKAFWLLGRALYRVKRIPVPSETPELGRARAWIDRALPRPDRPFPGWRYLALARYHQIQDRNVEALKNLLEARGHPEILLPQPFLHETLFILLAETYQATGDPETAMTRLREGLQVLKTSARLNEKLGLLFEDHGRFEEAERCIRTARVLLPGDSRLDRALARILAGRVRKLVSLKDPREFAALVREALELDPDLPLLAWLEARVLWKEGRLEKALQRVRRAVRALPGDALVEGDYLDLLKAVGYRWMISGRREGALRLFRELLDEAPEGFDTGAVQGFLKTAFLGRMEAGNRAVAGNRWEEAVEHFRSGLLLFPDHPGALRSLGITRYLSGDPESAEKDLRRSLHEYERQGGDPGTSLFYLLKVLGDGDRKAEARELAEPYLEGGKKDLIEDPEERRRIRRLLAAWG